jgi:hypothetical protein
VSPPAGRVRTLRYCRTDRKRQRGDAISTGISPACQTYLMLRRDVCCGSWSCKNALAEALTCRDVSEVAMRVHFSGSGGFFRPFALLMRLPAVLGSSSTANSRMSAATMPASPR